MRCSPNNVVLYLYRSHFFLLTCKNHPHVVILQPKAQALQEGPSVFSTAADVPDLHPTSLHTVNTLPSIASKHENFIKTTHLPPCGNRRQSFPTFIFICNLFSFSLDGSVETSKSNSNHLLLTVVPGNIQSPSKQETKQVFYLK